MATNEELLQRLENLERKVEQLFDSMTTVLEKRGSVNLEPDDREALKNFQLLSSQGGSSAAKRIFEINVNNDKITYNPDRKWSYRVGSSVQWVSQDSKFTIRLHGNDEYPSPYNRQRVIESSQHSDGTWRTEIFPIQPVLSDTERLARRLAGASGIQFTYMVAVEKDGKIITDDSRQGGPC